MNIPHKIGQWHIKDLCFLVFVLLKNNFGLYILMCVCETVLNLPILQLISNVFLISVIFIFMYDNVN